MNVRIATTLTQAYAPEHQMSDGVTVFISTLTCTCEACDSTSQYASAMFIFPLYHNFTICEDCATEFKITTQFDLRQKALIKQLKQSMLDNPNNEATPEPIAA